MPTISAARRNVYIERPTSTYICSQIHFQGEEFPDQKVKRIKAAMNKKVDDLLNEISFGPGASNLYSTTGCKRVGPKVDILLEDTLLEVT